MRCTIVAIGLRGDIQPMIALAAGLRASGTDVRCAVPSDFVETARAHGLDPFPLQGSVSALFGGATGVALRERLRDAEAYRRLFDDYLSLFFEKLLGEVWAACEGADVVVCSPWTRVGPSLAEALRVPVFVASTYPVMHLPTRAFPNPFQEPPHLPFGPFVNRQSWRAALPAMRVGDAPLNKWRRDVLGLAAIDWRDDLKRLQRLPHLFGYSPAVLPKPRDWPAEAHVTGYWFLDEASTYEPPAPLERFLGDGPPPIAIGFSSQVARNREAVTNTIVDAVERAGVRAVLVTGLGAMKDVELPERVFAVPSVPYDWLCPRIAAFVHHGGSGSTGMALRFGLPNFAVPFGYDQPLWGRRLHALGVGPAPQPAARLNVDRFAAALRQLVDNTDMRTRAAELASRLSQEDGTAAAVTQVTTKARTKD